MRWILVHLIEEYARHAGHADLIRESIDGSDRPVTTIRPASAEDWPQIWPFFRDTVLGRRDLRLSRGPHQ